MYICVCVCEQGQNLILNMNDHGFKVCAYNRTVEKVDKFLQNEAKGQCWVGHFFATIHSNMNIVTIINY